MNTVKKATNKIKKMSTLALGALLSAPVWADEADPLAPILSGKVKALFGSSASFWKIYILADIVLSLAALVKTKNYLIFIGTFVVALLPGFLVDTFVFSK